MQHISNQKLPRFLKLADVVNSFPQRNRSLKVLLLADDVHPANLVIDHIKSIKNYSQHNITIVNPRYRVNPGLLKYSNFDAILIHYSIYVISSAYLSEKWCSFIGDFSGAVAIIHEDEYQCINKFIAKFEELRIAALFSCLNSVDNLRLVYDNGSLIGTYFISCLPGYLPPITSPLSASTIANRPFDIVYRGRMLRPELGKLGYEKYLIGEQMKKVAIDHKLSFDICSDENRRIYGQSWPEFLGSGKVMLGVEGGASIFDFNGDIRLLVDEYLQSHPDASFPQIWDAILYRYEGNIQFRTITPKFFEAIACRTGLVLYPGEYNGILKPYKNYIPLERDLSNVAEVVSLICDNNYLQAMVDGNYEEIFSNPELHPEFYVKAIDRTLNFLSKPKDKSLMAKCTTLFRAPKTNKSL